MLGTETQAPVLTLHYGRRTRSKVRNGLILGYE
jgi:hypothetical protein